MICVKLHLLRRTTERSNFQMKCEIEHSSPMTVHFSLFRFAVHRVVMTSSSNYFQALLGPNCQKDEVTIAKIDGPTLKAIIGFCYSGKIEISLSNGLEIVEAASAMKFVEIKQKCEEFWTENLVQSNAVDIFLLADKYCFPVLRQKSFQFICEHFEAVACDKLLILNNSHFKEVLQCDKIQALE